MPWRSIDPSRLGYKEDSWRGGGVAERRYGAPGGIPSLGRFPRTEAFVAVCRQRHSVRSPLALTLAEPGHESGIPPMNPTSHVQFERPRTAPRPPPWERLVSQFAPDVQQ
jgi:hypothetical protein